MIDTDLFHRQIERIAIALEQLAPTPELGLITTSNKPKYLYVGKSGDCSWYFVKNECQVPVAETTIRGYLRNLSITDREWKNKINQKLNLVLDCKQQYIIQSGIETNFSRSILLSLRHISQADIKHPIEISVVPGEENTVFGHISIDNCPVRYDWDKNFDIIPLIRYYQQLFDFEGGA